MSWSEGRFQTRQTMLNNSATDLTGAAADIDTRPVVLPKMQLRTLGMSHTAASATVTTAAVISLDRINVNPIWDTLTPSQPVGTRVELGTVTAEAAATQYAMNEASLDPNAADNLTEAAFPEAYYGDIIILEHKTQGDGTQAAKLFYKYRELENRVDEVDGPSA